MEILLRQRGLRCSPVHVSLSEYRRKRDPARTPEPFGGESRRPGPIFVVQRHAARRLHYDLRLERDGVLASWAVPKGVPLERGQRHLAVHVEDHPLDYATFEGEIPAGQYGAGTVEIWDRRNVRAARGEAGRRPDGAPPRRPPGGVWTLVPAALDGDPRNWLLLRKDDGAGRRDSLPTDARDGGRDASRRARAGRSSSSRTATGRWLSSAGGEAVLRSRNGNDLTERFAAVATAIPGAVRSPDCVLDGEVCALDGDGHVSFSALQEGTGTLVYYVFDVLEVDGDPVVDRPSRDRRKLLESLLDPSPARAPVGRLRRR